jgi:hypothetical protein
MDFKEFMNPGDDAKLLLCACKNRDNVHLVIYPCDDEKLLGLLGYSDGAAAAQKPLETARKDPYACILFPSDVSLSQPEYMDYCKDMRVDWRERIQSSSESGAFDETGRPLTVIVVDAVWRHARKMAKHLQELIPSVPLVQLTPEQMSVYARKQTQPDRICTIEATALFLSQCGEDEGKCDQLVECVRINNQALKRKK